MTQFLTQGADPRAIARNIAPARGLLSRPEAFPEVSQGIMEPAGRLLGFRLRTNRPSKTPVGLPQRNTPFAEPPLLFHAPGEALHRFEIPYPRQLHEAGIALHNRLLRAHAQHAYTLYAALLQDRGLLKSLNLAGQGNECIIEPCTGP